MDNNSPCGKMSLLYQQKQGAEMVQGTEEHHWKSFVKYISAAFAFTVQKKFCNSGICSKVIWIINIIISVLAAFSNIFDWLCYWEHWAWNSGWDMTLWAGHHSHKHSHVNAHSQYTVGQWEETGEPRGILNGQQPGSVRDQWFLLCHLL